MAQSLPAVEPLIGDKPSKDLAHRDFAMYVDGNRVNCDVRVVRDSNGPGLTVTFTTSHGALDSPDVDPKVEIAWGGWKAGDSAHLYQPANEKLPSNGFVQIIRVKPPKKAGDPAIFVVKAVTPVYDHLTEQTICEGGEWAEIPASWFRR
jgi:hypothetical protein